LNQKNHPDSYRDTQKESKTLYALHIFFLLLAQKKETKKRAAKSARGGPLFLAGQRT
jgi:hypothetical protein